jgi:hypothetical protein
MAASKKTIQVSTITYDLANVSIPVTVDRDTKFFRATFAEKTFEHADGNTLEQIVLAAIKASLQVEWHPIIQVAPISSNSRYGVPRDETILGFDIERKWVALFPDGVYKEVQWDAQGDKEQYRLQWSHCFDWSREKLGAFGPPCILRGYGGRDTYYLPYTERLWDRFQVLLEKIKDLRTQILTLLGTQDGLEFLMTAAFPLALSDASEVAQEHV